MKITELKESSIRRFNLNGICWNDIFSGPLPDYDSSHVTMPKRKIPPSSTDTKTDRRKQTLPGGSSKDTTHRGKPGPKPMSPEAKKLKMEEQKKQRAEAKR